MSAHSDDGLTISNMLTHMQFELFRQQAPAVENGHTRHLVLAGRLVSYVLRRDRRRLALRIDERGLRVGAPRNLPLAEIDAFISQHADWVISKLDQHAQRSSPRYLPIHHGTRIPLLGEEAQVLVTRGANRSYWQTEVASHRPLREQAEGRDDRRSEIDDADKLGKSGESGAADGQVTAIVALWLAARPGADLPTLARRALQRRALEVFRPRLAAATARLGVATPPLALSSARTRWGSCSSRSGIRLNWRLIHLPLPLVDYVIAHEVAHLREMNHSARFWALVANLCPDWQQARADLKRLGATLPLI